MAKHFLVSALLVAALACGSDPAPTSPTTTTPPPTKTANCAATSVGLTPLTDLGGTYKGQAGRLYPGGNERPGGHDAAGLAIASAIGPRDGSGNPDPNGRYAFVSIGMSNTTIEFSAFMPMAEREPGKDPRLAIVDGAQSGQTAQIWVSNAFNSGPWAVLDTRLRQAGLTAAQVAVVWLKQADAQPTSGWPAYAQTLQDELETLLQRLEQHFPNLRIAYLSSRIYGGYAVTTLNPEPYAYESAFSVKAAIEDQLRGSPSLAYGEAGTARAPWLSWGPYLWTDGMKGRSDGVTWACSETRASDGTHPSDSGAQKVAQLLLDFIRTDATARAWFYQ